MFDSSDELDRIEKLKSIRESVNWEIEDERREFLWQLMRLTVDWEVRLPNLRDIYRNDEIDRVIAECVRVPNYQKPVIPYRVKFQIIDFVARAGYKYEPEVDERGEPLLNQTTAVHRAARNSGHFVFPALFEIYNGHDANYVDVESGLTHFHIACMYGCEGAVEKFLERGEEKGQPLQLDALRDNLGKTPLHYAVCSGNDKIYEWLLRRGADPNAADAQGQTALHTLCYAFVIERFLKFCDKINRRVQVDARDEKGNTSLHLAVDNGEKEVAELLLRKGANPTIANAKGSTPLHVVCTRYNDDSFPTMLLKYVKRKLRPKFVNAQDKMGNTPLHLALDYNRTRLAEWLMRNGADGNSTNAKGETPLHVACMHHPTKHLVSAFSRVNARDKDGNTPLHLALDNGLKDAVESLLRNGANPNLSNGEGQTPLHVACNRAGNDDGLIELLFKVNDELNRSVRVDARDYLGRTPLRLAMENVFPSAVDILLNRGADLTNFDFPSVNRMIYNFHAGRSSNPLVWFESKLRLVAGALICAERLEVEGYQLDRSDALTIMKLFAECQLFERSSDQQKLMCDDEEFAREAKEVMIKPDLSVYDLVRLKAKEEDKLLTYADYYDLPDRLRKIRFYASTGACALHLWEKMSRGFFQRWTLDPFRELINYRLPLEFCEKMLDQLANKDLFNICLAAAGPPSCTSSRWSSACAGRTASCASTGRVCCRRSRSCATPSRRPPRYCASSPRSPSTRSASSRPSRTPTTTATASRRPRKK